eukprot:SAG31_NODE_8584_length_1425_cov_7.232278_1_plen_143_part_00
MQLTYDTDPDGFKSPKRFNLTVLQQIRMKSSLNNHRINLVRQVRIASWNMRKMFQSIHTLHDHKWLQTYHTCLARCRVRELCARCALRSVHARCCPWTARRAQSFSPCSAQLALLACSSAIIRRCPACACNAIRYSDSHSSI